MKEINNVDASGYKQLMLILNPVSGRRMGAKSFPEIINLFTSNGYLVTAFVTGKKGDAHEYVKKFCDRFDLVACIGGDGTLNEVVSGMAESGTSLPLGLIPVGSTNDFAICHHISQNIMAAANDIISGKTANLDIGTFNSRFFTYIAAFGAFSWLSYTTPQNLKNLFGHAAYILDGLKDLPLLKSEYMRITADQTVLEGNYIFGAVCNSTSIAGIFNLPTAFVDMNDGEFEILLIRSPSSLAELQAIFFALRNQDYSYKYIDLIKAKNIRIETEASVQWSLDGEYECGHEIIEIRNIPGALKMITND